MRGGLPYTFTQTNHYDGLNRLTSASDSGGWSHNYGYDQYGNMWLASSTGPAQSGLMPTPTNAPDGTRGVDAATNRVKLGGVTYDPGGTGKIMTAGPSSLAYDAEDRLVKETETSANITDYTYDGLGQRVTKAGEQSQITTVYLYDAFGNLAAEYAYAPPSVVLPAPPCWTCYISDDLVGNTRMVTDQGGAVQGSHDYYPYGGEIAGTTAQRSTAWGTTDYLSQKYTGQERDGESGLDHFPARHFASAMGRFMRPDPVGNFVADVTNPQSWNMYSYAGGNPAMNIDPTGLFTQVPCNSQGLNPIDGSTFCDNSSVVGIWYGTPGMTVSEPGPQDGGFTTYAGFMTFSDENQTRTVEFSPSTFACVAGGLRAVIAHGEGTDKRPGGGYGTVALGTVIGAPDQFKNLIGTRNAQIANPSALTGHPNILVHVNGSLNSTAFGRYQILIGTARQFNFKDFSPAGQDAAANTLMQSKQMITLAQGGGLEQAIHNGGKIWASLPGSPYGQPTISMSTALATYSKSLGGCRSF